MRIANDRNPIAAVVLLRRVAPPLLHGQQLPVVDEHLRHRLAIRRRVAHVVDDADHARLNTSFFAGLFEYQSTTSPIGVAVPKNWRATVRLMTITVGAPAASVASSPRPSTNRTPIVGRYPSLTDRTRGLAGAARISAACGPRGTNVPTTSSSVMRMPARVKPAASTPGMARSRVRIASMVSALRRDRVVGGNTSCRRAPSTG